MKAVTLVPGTSNVRLADIPEPRVFAKDTVKMRVVRVGICGTDREEASGGRVKASGSSRELVIGHEMLGLVVETGKAVSRVRPGDYAVFTVRRGCGSCVSCLMGRPDMCRSGRYQERGIWGLDGFQAQFVIDSEAYAVRVPSAIEPAGVLTEPLSVAEKAIDEAVRIQNARLPAAAATPLWLHGRRCLVAGLGPVGLLAALALRLRGAEVFGIDVVNPDSPRPRWLNFIGGIYIDGRRIPPERVQGLVGAMDLIIEAAGVPSLEFNLIDALAINGIYVLTGIPSGNSSLQLQGAELVRRLVLGNQIMIGSVNASRDHYQMAVDDLTRAQLLWGDHLQRLVSHRRPYSDFKDVLARHEQDEIKVTLEWSES
jgi:threonine dehydrogenase-like Zn-dependent dehydrogenase